MKRSIKVIISLMLVLVLGVASVSAFSATISGQLIDGWISGMLGSKTQAVSLYVGASSPVVNTASKLYNITSSNTRVVTATPSSSGAILRGVSAGTAVVTATWEDKTVWTYNVTVRQTATVSNTPTITVGVGGTDTIADYNVSIARIANESVARVSVSNGVCTITGVSVGSTYFYFNGTHKTAGTTVTQKQVNVTVSATGGSGGTSGSSNLSLAVGQTDTAQGLYCTSAYSNNASIASASVVAGQLTVTGVSAGTTYVVYSGTLNGATVNNQMLTVTVSGTGMGAGTGSVSGVTVAVGGTQSVAIAGLTSAICADTSKATVSLANGTVTVTGRAVGTTSVYYTTSGSSGMQVLPVTVSNTAANVPVATASRITIGSKAAYSVNRGKSYTLGVTLDGVSISSDRSRVLWVSSNTSVITVNAKGQFKAVGSGTANLIAVTKEGDSVAKVSITVK